MKHTAYLYVYWSETNHERAHGAGVVSVHRAQPHVTDSSPDLGGPFHFVREIPIEIPDEEWTRAVDDAARKFLPDEDKT